MQKITPFLWFNDRAEEAMNFYVSVFKDASIGSVSRYTDAGPGPSGSVMVGTFKLFGQEFLALNGGPHFTFNQAISFVVNCESQEEVDYLWERLSEGGQKSRCSWLQDQFGVWWQIVPTILGKLMSDPDKAKAKRVTEAMLQMDKIDIAKLLEAYDKL